MFTGIVEEIGEIVGVERGPASTMITLRGQRVTGDASHGDSVAVNGVCLTVVATAGETFTVDVVAETLTRSSLARAGNGDRVNLERAAVLGDRIGGHLVQGHVDGTAEMLGRDAEGLSRFRLPPELTRYLVEKGSVTLDGVSLTVAWIAGEELTVALIPTTLSDTTLGEREPGDVVNVEVDVIAKHLERLVRPYDDGAAGRRQAPVGDNVHSGGRSREGGVR